MMHHVQRTGLTAHAVVGQLERRVRRRTLSIAGRKAMLEAELMTSCRGVTCWDCGNEGRAFFEAGPATAAAAVGFVARAATGNITKRHLPCGMNLARALVFLRGIDLLSCVYCDA
jgi:hypothetical protein